MGQSGPSYDVTNLNLEVKWLLLSHWLWESVIGPEELGFQSTQKSMGKGWSKAKVIRESQILNLEWIYLLSSKIKSQKFQSKKERVDNWNFEEQIKIRENGKILNLEGRSNKNAKNTLNAVEVL